MFWIEAYDLKLVMKPVYLVYWVIELNTQITSTSRKLRMLVATKTIPELGLDGISFLWLYTEERKMAMVVEGLRSFNAYFWDEKFWLPEKVSWKDFENTGDIYHPVVTDLHYVVYCAICLFFVRKLYERWVTPRPGSG